MDDQQNQNLPPQEQQQLDSQHQNSANNYPPGPNNVFDTTPLSVGQYLGMMLLLVIPIVNIILLFIWGFGDNNINKRNFAKAQLIMVAIGITISILLMVIIGGLVASFSPNFSY